jgi:solute:Na+ symporter, SSS family
MRFLRKPPAALVLALLVLCATAAFADEDAVTNAEGLNGRLGALDWCVIVVYALGMLGIGFYYSRRTETSEDYYLGGRKMRPSMVGLSLFATLISTISYLAWPGEVMGHGPVAALMYIAALPIVYVVVCYFLIPHIMKLPITSAYEILEVRLGRPVRLLGSIIFLLVRLMWMALVAFTASRAVVTAMGLDPGNVKYAVIALGIITVIYSSMGGLRAVVLTDVIQSAILFTGALVCIVIVTVKVGGLGWLPTEWSPNWDKQPLISFDPTVRVTVFGSIVATTLWWICTAGSDQMAIQRYLATRDVKAARRAFLVNSAADVVVTLLLVALGFALLGFFRANPQYMSENTNLSENAEYLFPHFIVNFMGFGMAGLVMSGMLAAAMSSLSSGVNSASTVINTDLVGPFIRRELSEAAKIRLGKWISLGIGVVVILLGLGIGKVPGNLYEVTAKTNGLFVAPLFGLFFFAMFVPFSTSYGAVFGSLYGFVAAVVVAFWDQTGAQGLSFQYILAVSLAVDIAVGCLLSLVPYDAKSRGFRIGLNVAASIPLVVVVGLFARACMT